MREHQLLAKTLQQRYGGITVMLVWAKTVLYTPGDLGLTGIFLPKASLASLQASFSRKFRKAYLEWSLLVPNMSCFEGV